MILNALFVLLWCISASGRYILYYSDTGQHPSQTFDCLYAYMMEDGKENSKQYIRNYHLIPYCRRLDDYDEEQNEMKDSISGNIGKTISFKELKKQNITSEQLLQWFAPIDVVEKYEMNFNDSDVFHNCSSSWFGSRCQYKLSYHSSVSFSDIVDISFSNQKGILTNFTGGTCYRFLTGCNDELWPLCLDWREICDGKTDCLNGQDEELCDQLEMNECNSNEYRCHYGGQCIPLSFLKDNRLSIDCLDGSDEIEIRYYLSSLMNEHCASLSTFRCQERIARYHQSFTCGDGQYLIGSKMPLLGAYCTDNRDKELSRTLLTSLDHISDTDCRQSFYCALHYNRKLAGDIYLGDQNVGSSILIDDEWEKSCEPLSKHCLSKWLVIPAQPIMFGFFQFVYFTNRSVEKFSMNIAPDFVCFHAHRCPTLLSDIIPIEIITGLTCSSVFDLVRTDQMKNFEDVLIYFYPLGERCSKTSSDKSCSNSSYFHCNRSMKCIPLHRVGDGNIDCLYKEDELFNSCQWNNSNRFKCTSNENKCLMPVTIGDGIYDCAMGEDELFAYTQNLMELLPFSILCDGDDNYWTFLDNSNGTDESNCNWWPCNNPYTHCNGKWNCPNGIDELNCPDSRCSLNEYECQAKESNFSYCLSRTHMYEKYFSNCSNRYLARRELYFYNGTNNISDDYYSWNISKCISEEKLCRDRHPSQISTKAKEVCLYQPRLLISSSVRIVHLIQNKTEVCNLKFSKESSIDESIMPSFAPFFKAAQLGFLPEISINHSNRSNVKIHQSQKIINNINSALASYCHRGIVVLTGRNQTKKCLCPPNYFGSQCQWQNQRISLTLQLHWRSTTFITVIFQVVIMLIDGHGQITSYHEQLTYMPNRDCNTKFNIYLLYPDRPKSFENNYSIRIDFYEKSKLNYWASWFISIPFQFLPVNRIATQLIIPEFQDNDPCNLSCGEHGKCQRYTNNKSLFFCQCNQGYSGSLCQIKDKCSCSSDSYCLNSSICICPLHKFGRYCHLRHSICQSSCQHNGLCVPIDDRIGLKSFTCFCPDNYSGSRCENENNRIDIHLDKTILTNTSLLLLHFLTSFPNAEHERITTLKKIPFADQNLTIYVTQPFNILFLQIPNQDYYLTILREVFIPSEHLYTKISSKQRCVSVNELNKTLFVNEYFIRVKYYPLLCRDNPQLMCFYDHDLMCICDINRFSNCFLFNYTMNNDCQGFNHCENGGQCFQNNETCPTKSTCICQDCYYGSRCQFSTKGFIISLDSILAYHIKPNLSIDQQPLIIKVSITISTIIFLLGFINGLLSIMTFRRKNSRRVGTGNYLFISSIVSLIMIIILTMKFWQLIIFQMSLINNRSLLLFNCISIDVTLNILLSFYEWLNACVAMERMMSVIKGTYFNRKQSQKVSKWVIISVLILCIVTRIHDPIHRVLIDDIDIDEKRIWCFVQYSSSMGIYNIVINFIHFFVPFLLNIISALWIIISTARNRSDAQPDQTFQQHLRHQIYLHRNLLLAPFVFTLLSVPRLIISFLSGCMRSAHEPWLFLFGYFLSFIPSMLIFIVFVLPSKYYKKEFRTVVQRTVRRFRTGSVYSY